MQGTTFSCPFTKAFRAAINRGTPASIAVTNISQRQGKAQQTVINSLKKAGQLQGQQFNGQWICWATDGSKAPSTMTRTTQAQLWQAFVDWAIASGHATPQQLANAKGSQSQFSQSCRRFFNRQFNTTGPSTGRMGTPRRHAA